MKKLFLVITVIAFLIGCKEKSKSEPVEIVKVVFENGHIDTLKLTSPVRIEWNTLYSDGRKVANGVGYIKKIN
jgi:hypothetical protein